jgi:hypothetical protein
MRFETENHTIGMQ